MLYIMTAVFVVILVALEDIQDTIAHHGGGIFRKWPYAEMNWKRKYVEGGDADGDGVPWEWEDRNWWGRLGPIVAFADLWHAAKAVRLLLVFGLIAYAFKLPYWGAWVVPMWFVYGQLHDRVFYGRLYQ